MARNPIAGSATDDDDLVVTLADDEEDDFAPGQEETVADQDPRDLQPLESPTLPDVGGDIENEDVEEEELQARGDAATDEGGEQEYSEAYERAQAAEEQLRQERANSVYKAAESEAWRVDQQRNNIKVGQDALALRLDVAYGHLSQLQQAGEDTTRVQRDIREMENLRGELEQAGRQLPDPQAIINDGKARAQQVLNAAPQGTKVGSGIQARHPLAERWAKTNGWMRTNTSANRFVIGQSQAMTNEGWDPNSPGFYQELGKRVKNAYPNLRIMNLQAQKRAPGKAQVRSPVAPVRSASGQGGARTSNGRRTFVLDKGERAKMKRFNLDPTNKAHQRAWAETRMESAARERSMRG